MTGRDCETHSQAGMVLHKEFDDIEDLRISTRSWDLDFLQLQRGRFNGSLTQVITPSWQLSHAHFASALKQEGMPPMGLRNIAIPATPCQNFKWRRHEISGNSIMLFPLDSELDSVSRAGFEVCILAVPEAHLDHICSALGFPSIEALTNAAEVVQCCPSDLRQLRCVFRSCIRSIVRKPKLIHQSSFWSTVESDLCSRLLLALARGLAVHPEESSRRQQHVLKVAEAFIKAHAHQAPTIHDLCQRHCIRERTLRSAFQRRYGVSPKAFLMTYRLSHARRQLREHPPGSLSIQDAAAAWGFWHMGQFAHDYKTMFNELPSETLAKAFTSRMS